jgi:hypothetical protein
VPEHHARQRLDLDVPHRGALVLGEVFHLRLGELDVLDVARAQLRKALADLGVGEPVVVPVPRVEFLRELAHRGVAARGDVGEDALDDAAHLGVLGRDRRRVPSALQPTRHGVSPSLCSGRLSTGSAGGPTPPGSVAALRASGA